MQDTTTEKTNQDLQILKIQKDAQLSYRFEKNVQNELTKVSFQV
jgi:hypothetical protein